MAQLPGERKLIFQEDIRYKAGVSEGVGTKLGNIANFISLYQHSDKQFFINGFYEVFAGQTFIDGLVSFTFAAEIFDIVVFNAVVGTSGTTEIDVKYSPSVGSAFTSIFTTTPKITTAAANDIWFRVGSSLTGTTAPVATTFPFQVAANSAMRIDLVQAMPNGQNCGVILHYRPV